MFTQSSFGKMWVQIYLISSTSTYMIVFTPPSQTPELLYKYLLVCTLVFFRILQFD